MSLDVIMVKKQNAKQYWCLEFEMHRVDTGWCILKVLKQEEMFGFRFWRLKDRKKGMPNAISGKKLTSKMYLVYLHVKLTQYDCAYFI